MIKYPMTVRGAKALEEEHAHLTKVVRPKLSQDIGTARELGDLKENAEYHAAREQQGMVEARIRDIEGRMQNAVIIDVTTIPHTAKLFSAPRWKSPTSRLTKAWSTTSWVRTRLTSNSARSPSVRHWPVP